MLAALLLSGSSGAVLFAQEERIIDEEPYDEITLTAANQNQVLKVLPLAPFKRPANPTPNEALRVRLVENPTEEIDVLWTGIEQVVTFGDRVLTAARKELDANRFDEAFEYIKFVRDNYPTTNGLQDALDQALYAEARAVYRDGGYERALMLLDEVYQREPAKRGLVPNMQRVLETQFNVLIKAGDFQEARKLYERSRAKYGRDMEQLLAGWQAKLLAEGNRLLNGARQQMEAGSLRDAYLSSRQVLEVWPATPGAEQFAQQAAQRYPLLRVGVSQVSGSNIDDPRRAYNWAARRTERLEHRKVFELRGTTADGAD
ncbi:MAG: hypothetical protein KDA92_24335, partial [Planctomycetales bacterium]|nr:hypothetical protein [Planctomycetales bacterium]